MPAYVIVDVSTTDPNAMAAYGPLAAASVEQHDGRLGQRSFGDPQGYLNPERVVVIDFAAAEAA